MPCFLKIRALAHRNNTAVPVIRGAHGDFEPVRFFLRHDRHRQSIRWLTWQPRPIPKMHHEPFSGQLLGTFYVLTPRGVSSKAFMIEFCARTPSIARAQIQPDGCNALHEREECKDIYASGMAPGEHFSALAGFSPCPLDGQATFADRLRGSTNRADTRPVGFLFFFSARRRGSATRIAATCRDQQSGGDCD